MKPHWQKAFLAALERTGSVTAAAEAGKISRVTLSGPFTDPLRGVEITIAN